MADAVQKCKFQQLKKLEASKRIIKIHYGVDIGRRKVKYTGKGRDLQNGMDPSKRRAHVKMKGKFQTKVKLKAKQVKLKRKRVVVY